MNNENLKTGYKVVLFLEEGSYNSYLANTRFLKENACLGSSIEYLLNQKVYPQEGCGPLCVFDTLEDVKKFLIKEEITLDKSYNTYSSPFSYKIFKCNYEESKKIKVWIKNEHVFRQNSIFSLPKGTRLASWVELIEEVVEL